MMKKKKVGEEKKLEKRSFALKSFAKMNTISRKAEKKQRKKDEIKNIRGKNCC